MVSLPFKIVRNKVNEAPKDIKLTEEPISYKLSREKNIELGNKTPELIDERQTSLPMLGAYEKLYQTDPLVFRAVQMYVEQLSQGFVVSAVEEERKLVEDWIEDTGFKFAVQDGIRDIFIYGNWFLELHPDFQAKTLTFTSLNPKNVDYIRNLVTGKVLIDEDGKPLGYKVTVNSKDFYYMNKRITEGGFSKTSKVYTSNSKIDYRDMIAHFKLFSFSDSYLGYPPLAAVNKSALIRLNISDMVGTSSYRGGTRIAHTEGVLSKQHENELADTLLKATPDDIVVLDSRITLDNMPTPDVANKEKIVYYYADEVCTGLGVPLPLLMAGTGISSNDRDAFSTIFEDSVKPLQERLMFQIRNNVLVMLWRVLGKKTPVPQLKIVDKSTSAKMNVSRALSTLARRNLIKYDPELEVELRNIYNLPTSFADKELELWKKEGKRLEDTTEVDKTA